MNRFILILLLFFLNGNIYSQLSIDKYELQLKVDSSLNKITVSEQIKLSGNLNADTSLFLNAIHLGSEKIKLINLNFNLNQPNQLVKNENGLWETEVLLKKSVLNNQLINLRYEINHAADRLQIPILFLSIKPKDSKDDIFIAKIEIPQGFQLNESFPTHAKLINDNIYQIGLQTIPSMIELKIDKEGGFYMGRTLWVDIIVIILLIGVSYMVWVKRKSLR